MQGFPIADHDKTIVLANSVLVCMSTYTNRHTHNIFIYVYIHSADLRQPFSAMRAWPRRGELNKRCVTRSAVATKMCEASQATLPESMPCKAPTAQDVTHICGASVAPQSRQSQIKVRSRGCPAVGMNLLQAVHCSCSQAAADVARACFPSSAPRSRHSRSPGGSPSLGSGEEGGAARTAGGWLKGRQHGPP